MSFARLRVADWVAFIAALALLLSTAVDWYSTQGGEEARRIQELAEPGDGATAGDAEREVEASAAAAAEGEERNAWQMSGSLDLLILAGVLATAALAVLAAFSRAAGRGYELLGPTVLCGLTAAGTALLVTFRMIQEPGLDEATTVQVGAPLALLMLGTIAIACAASVRAEESEGARSRLPEASAAA